MQYHRLIGYSLWLVLALGGCQSSDTSPSPRDATAPADTSPETSVPDTSSPRDGTDRPEDGEARDGSRDAPLGDRSPREEEMVRFSYQGVESTCQVGDCTEGVAVQFISRDLVKITSANERPERLAPSDYETLRDLLIDDLVIRKMKRGWQCGDERTHNQVEHQFRARFRFSDVGRPQIRTISGCIPRNSPYRDAERVRTIVETLEEMKLKYFDDT